MLPHSASVDYTGSWHSSDGDSRHMYCLETSWVIFYVSVFVVFTLYFYHLLVIM